MVLRGSLTRYVVAVVALALVAVFLGMYAAGRASAVDRRCGQHRDQSAERARLVTGSGDRVSIVGDSWSVGLGLDDLADSWPSRLPGQVRVAGFSGSGYSASASPCGNQSFAARVTPAVTDGAAVVVVQGGLNDFDRTDAAIERGFRRLMERLATSYVVVLGPAAAPARDDRMPRVEADLERLADEYAVPYVATSDLELDYLDDHLHLTEGGHQEYGDAVAEGIADVEARRPLLRR